MKYRGEAEGWFGNPPTGTIADYAFQGLEPQARWTEFDATDDEMAVKHLRTIVDSLFFTVQLFAMEPTNREVHIHFSKQEWGAEDKVELTLVS